MPDRTSRKINELAGCLRQEVRGRFVRGRGAATVLALHATGLGAVILYAFASDLALVLAAALALLCMPLTLRFCAWIGRSSAGIRQWPP